MVCGVESKGDFSLFLTVIDPHNVLRIYKKMFHLNLFQLLKEICLLQNGVEGGEFSYKSCLSPPMPPLAPTSKLKRISSSVLSLSNRTKKKILTVSTFENQCNEKR